MAGQSPSENSNSDNNRSKNARNIAVDDIIDGDLFSGIAVSELTDREYQINRNILSGNDGETLHVTGRIIQRVNTDKEDRIILGFLFLLDSPFRLRLEVLVPDNCTNACVTLADRKLIGYFSDVLPEDPELMISGDCADGGSVSTLVPGEFQSINFNWESGDVLKFHFYF